MKTASTIYDLDGAVARLDDYVRGLGDDSATVDFEDELFERALLAEAPELTFFTQLSGTLRAMNERGTIDLWLTSSQVEKLRASGKVRAAMYEFNPAAPVAPEIPPGTELLITRVPFDLSGIRSLEVEILSLDGKLIKTMPDIAFDPADGAVFACCEADLARIAGAQQTITRVWASDDTGRRMVVELPSF